jgi:hypothetical protein
LSWTAAARIAQSTAYPYDLTDAALLSQPRPAIRTDMQTERPEALHGTIDVPVTRDGVIDAIAGWFRAQLAEDVWMTNGPHERRIRRRPALLAINPPVPVSTGETLSIDIRVRPTTSILAWCLQVIGTDGRVRQRVARSTFAGLLVADEDLVRARPDHVPHLSRAGALRQSVLNLCDGRRTLQEIEQALYAANRDFFHSPEAAARFAAEVLQRYGE